MSIGYDELQWNFGDVGYSLWFLELWLLTSFFEFQYSETEKKLILISPILIFAKLQENNLVLAIWLKRIFYCFSILKGDSSNYWFHILKSIVHTVKAKLEEIGIQLQVLGVDQQPK